MTLPAVTDSMIVSRYGNRAVEWDQSTLHRVLSELRRERKRYRERYQTPENGADTLFREAEQVKATTQNKIHEVGSSA
jgi:hypothetical protein